MIKLFDMYPQGIVYEPWHYEAYKKVFVTGICSVSMYGELRDQVEQLWAESVLCLEL